MIIVSGKLFVRAQDREAFLTGAAEAMAMARKTTGCLDFVVAADPIEPDRVNVYEAWQSEQHLNAFRQDGPGEDLSAFIVRADIAQHKVAP